ncbi:hypothetical protein [Xanthomonas vesicatoria]|uniref:Uncharacterized protein n=1 Tax=Xanthomonas vesicatoria TaxID=56460 RepID=A0AAJ0IW69_9XANT|nr:hypothetical protein [Xanthomonas vesicatoria]APO93686.1 hypothetical protein BI313_02805 [Xanthomonas vesicatoria]APP77504.1 hypothetical protein BJD12_22350 [Xanthomonas vesicatoria ATCC 35937]KHM91506.1 hypothetical protein OR60_19380 [Xanthomonas vesicatoria]KHM91957.1 hypothetical protein OR61_17845 [Xanthomonas vesicatoria]MCC8622526.1 hypothetical protein [Xanthomonas vesicatoria]
MSAALPTSYTAWRHCIEIDCAQPLTAPFIAQRLTSLRDSNDHHTQQFVRRWGQAHHQQVIGWFERARTGVGAGALVQ